MPEPIFQIKQASFGYLERGAEHLVVQDVSLQVSTGDFVVLEGYNGSGKTTFIRGLLGLIPVVRGNMQWHIPRTGLGYIPQEATMDPDVPATALDVVRTAEPFNWKGSYQECSAALERVGMGGKAPLLFSSLSGGQKRRVLVAKALAGNPRLLILDEPTVNVDKETEESLEQLLYDLCEAGEVGVIAATHARHWALRARRCVIEGGRIRG